MDQARLSGGAKFGYFALGFFLALIGVLITWLVNKDKEQALKSSAIKFSVIGCVVSIVFWIIVNTVLVGSMMSMYGAYL